MKLTKRQSTILYILSSAPHPTVKGISETLKVSPQTVRTELQNLKVLFDPYGISAEARGGDEVVLENAVRLPQLLKASEALLQFSLENQILLLLVLNNGFLTLQNIADELYVSKSLIEKQMPDLLKKFGDCVRSLRHYGYQFTGSEVGRRDLFVTLVSPYFTGLSFEKSFLDFNDLHFPILRFVEREDLERALSVIGFLQDFQTPRFTDEALGQMFLYLLISFRNIRREDGAQVGQEFLPILKQFAFFDRYMELCEKIDTALNLDLPPNERYYLCYLLVGLKKQKPLDRGEIVERMRGFILKAFEQVKAQLQLDFFSDERLLEGLALHVYTAILLQKDSCNNSYDWKDIKEQYPLGFEAAAILSKMIESEYGNHITDNERIYLTLHFQNSIEHMDYETGGIRAVVVCHYGVAAANLIWSKVEKLYPQIRVVSTYSLQEFNHIGLPDCDVVITTEKLSAGGLPVIYVSPFLKEMELRQFDVFLEENRSKGFLQTIVRDAVCLDLPGGLGKDEVIGRMAGRLEELGAVSGPYARSVLEREQISSTGLKWIAAPHGDPHCVLNTRLCIARIRDGVRWDENLIRCVFMLAISADLLKKPQTTFVPFYRRLARLNFENKFESLQNRSVSEWKEDLAKLFQ